MSEAVDALVVRAAGRDAQRERRRIPLRRLRGVGLCELAEGEDTQSSTRQCQEPPTVKVSRK
jgi:hypothetical protein